MDYLTNYYKNLSEQLQVKVNALNSQLNEYLVQKGEKDGKKGVWRGSKFTPDEEIKFDPERNKWLDSQKVKPKTKRGDIGEPDYSKYKVNIDDVTREFRKRSDRLNVDTKFPDTDNIKVPDKFYNEKQKSPYINKYGDPDAIDVMPTQRKDMISSIDKLKKPIFDNNNFY